MRHLPRKIRTFQRYVAAFTEGGRHRAELTRESEVPAARKTKLDESETQFPPWSAELAPGANVSFRGLLVLLAEFAMASVW